MTATRNVVVVGGGLAGLLTGVELKRRGMEVTVLEASSSPGGVASTIRDQGYLLEPAAGTLLLPHQELSPILAAAGIKLSEAPTAARRRWVYRKGRLMELKDSPAIMASPVLSAWAKLRALREPWISQSVTDTDESLLGFATRRFGPELGPLLATVMAHGVFAGDPASMSARGAFPRLVALEDNAGSVVKGGIRRMKQRPRSAPRAIAHFAPEGMRSVAEALANSLGVRFRSSWPVERISRDGTEWIVEGPGRLRARSVIVALAPAEAVRLVPAAIGAVLRQGVSAPVAVVGLGGRAADVPVPPGFGFLTGPGEDIHALGMLFDSEYATGRAPAGCRLVKAIYGGAADPGVMTLDDGALVRLAAKELGRALGRTVYPSWTWVTRHAQGIPQYGIGHPEFLARLDVELGGYPGLYVTGWGYRGIGVSSLAGDAVRVADLVQTER